MTERGEAMAREGCPRCLGSEKEVNAHGLWDDPPEQCHECARVARLLDAAERDAVRACEKETQGGPWVMQGCTQSKSVAKWISDSIRARFPRAFEEEE